MFKILIIEDDDFKSRRLKEFLNQSMLNIEIYESNNLKNAIEFINTNIYDLILIDMAIPSHPMIPGEGSPYSLLNGGIEIILELDYLNRKDDCIIITQYPEIEISGQFFSIEDATGKIKEILECDVLGCIEYSEESEDWKYILGSKLEKYENFNFRR